MCHEDFKILRVSNRGQNCFQSVANQTYRVNIPSELRVPNKKIKVSVINATMAFNTDNTFDTYTEIGVISNLPTGYDTESDSSYNSKNYQLLFNIDTSTYGKQNNKLITFHTHDEAFEFMVGNIPEKLEFTSVSTTGAGVLAPITNNNYISFVLKLTYYDN
jgi:hypothetical protein